MPTTYLGTGAFAKRVGLATATIRSYIVKGLTPEPDVIIIEGRDQVRGWSEATIDHWQANRPGRGKRTDLDTRKNWQPRP